MVSGGMVCVKYLLFFFNLLFWMSGLALIIVGAVVKAKFGEFIQVGDSRLTTGPVFLIVIGVVIGVVGFLGCCGAYKENYCMVTTFAVLLAIIFILEITAGALAYAFRNDLEKVAKDGLKNAVDNYSEESYRNAIDKAQKEFDCCGANGYEDYFKVNISDSTAFPASCCLRNLTTSNITCPTNFGEARNIAVAKRGQVFVSKGCVDGFEKYLREHLIPIGGVGIGVAFIQLIGIVFACCLMRSIKKEYEVM